MKQLATVIGMAVIAITQSLAQSKTTTQQSGDCSINNGEGSNNQLMIDCRGVGKEQGNKIIAILNKMLAKGVDTDAVMTEILAKEDEIIANQKKQGAEIDKMKPPTWRGLTDQQMRDAVKVLNRFPEVQIRFTIPQPMEADRDAIILQLAQMFTMAGWRIVSPPEPWTNFSLLPFNTPHVIQLLVSEPSGACTALRDVLSAIFGRSNISDCIEDPSMKGAKNMIRLVIWPPAPK